MKKKKIHYYINPLLNLIGFLIISLKGRMLNGLPVSYKFGIITVAYVAFIYSAVSNQFIHKGIKVLSVCAFGGLFIYEMYLMLLR